MSKYYLPESKCVIETSWLILIRNLQVETRKWRFIVILICAHICTRAFANSKASFQTWDLLTKQFLDSAHAAMVSKGKRGISFTFDLNIRRTTVLLGVCPSVSRSGKQLRRPVEVRDWMSSQEPSCCTLFCWIFPAALVLRVHAKPVHAFKVSLKPRRVSYLQNNLARASAWVPCDGLFSSNIQ